jgi:hypothetical protein
MHLNRPNLFQLIAYDPGGTIGFFHAVVDFHAFSRPENKLLSNLLYWNCGELSGSEAQQEIELTRFIDRHHFKNGRRIKTQVIGEDFDLVQTIGGADLLSPVRINAVIKWECDKIGVPFALQRRHLRMGVTRERLKLWGFNERWKKDEFAATQHGMYYLRTLKQHTLSKPWKLESDSSTNARWDCSCARNKRRACDLVHPK